MILIVLFLAGNFPQLSKIEKEKAMSDHITSLGYEYHRLMTFFYIKDCRTILTVGKELKEKTNESRPPGVKRHLIKTNTRTG